MHWTDKKCNSLTELEKVLFKTKTIKQWQSTRMKCTATGANPPKQHQFLSRLYFFRSIHVNATQTKAAAHSLLFKANIGKARETVSGGDWLLSRACLKPKVRGWQKDTSSSSSSIGSSPSQTGRLLINFDWPPSKKERIYTHKHIGTLLLLRIGSVHSKF